MSFSKIDLEKIKSKIRISSELEKKSKLVKKGKDYWCCCPFHEEKTPSCKINDDQGSFYCFGCGAKGDIFTLFTDLYNYSFVDAVKELSQRVGVKIEFQDLKTNQQENKVNKILHLACDWFQRNLKLSEAINCQKYLTSRNISQETINQFKLGYSFNSNTSLYNYLKNKSFTDEEIIKSNVVKIDKNKKIRDYFFKRLIFPITNAQGNIVGFGGRTLDSSNPKYINSPESSIFQKRYLLYNLVLAKEITRKKNNLLICEGYMDVISLYQNGIQSVVAPLGTALTEEQIQLAWKYTSKPTIMFDGDDAGIRASYKSAIMSLPLISPKKFLQFIIIPKGFDPDSLINSFSLKEFGKLLKKPQPLINFIFNHSSMTINLTNVDQKISYDKYLDDLVDSIKDKKTKYFYRNEFKSLFFQKIRNKEVKIKSPKKLNTSLQEKQILSFIASALNHIPVRKKIIDELLYSNLINDYQRKFLKKLRSDEMIEEKIDKLIKNTEYSSYSILINSCSESSIFQLFPYSKPTFDPKLVYAEVSKSLQNLNTRLLNLKKINKSLDTFVDESNQLNWSELQNINLEVLDED